MNRVERVERSVVAMAVKGLEQSVAEQCGAPGVAVIDRDCDGLSVLLAGPPEDVLDAAAIVIPGIAADCAGYSCDSWAMILTENDAGAVPRVNMGDLALNHGGLEAGLVAESLAITVHDRDDGSITLARFYQRLPGKRVVWTPSRDYRQPSDGGRVPTYIATMFAAQTLRDFTAEQGTEFDLDFTTALVLQSVQAMYGRLEVATHRA